MKLNARLLRCAMAAALLWIGAAASLSATELVYQPVNPSFGGFPANGAYLLDSALAQNKLKPPASDGFTLPQSDPLADFEESLNRRILSILADKVVSSAFGEEGLESGHFVIGDYVIDVGEAGTGIDVVITDPTSGNTTTINVPSF